MNKKLILLESNQLILNNTNNNYSTIHNNTISTKGRTSSRWSKTKDRERDREEILISNISHLTSNNTNLSVKKKKIINTKYSKLEMRAIGNSNERTLSRGNSTNLIKLNSKKKRSNQGITTIDNNSKISETYNKIFNSLLSVKSNNNLTTKKTIAAKSNKKNSASMLI